MLLKDQTPQPLDVRFDAVIRPVTQPSQEGLQLAAPGRAETSKEPMDVWIAQEHGERGDGVAFVASVEGTQSLLTGRREPVKVNTVVSRRRLSFARPFVDDESQVVEQLASSGLECPG